MLARKRGDCVICLKGGEADRAIVAHELRWKHCGQALDDLLACRGLWHCLVEAEKQLVIVGGDFAGQQVEDL